MKTGMNLLLWTTHVTQDHFPILEKLKKAGFDGVEIHGVTLNEIEGPSYSPKIPR